MMWSEVENWAISQAVGVKLVTFFLDYIDNGLHSQHYSKAEVPK